MGELETTTQRCPPWRIQKWSNLVFFCAVLKLSGFSLTDEFSDWHIWFVTYHLSSNWFKYSNFFLKFYKCSSQNFRFTVKALPDVIQILPYSNIFSGMLLCYHYLNKGQINFYKRFNKKYSFELYSTVSIKLEIILVLVVNILD